MNKDQFNKGKILLDEIDNAAQTQERLENNPAGIAILLPPYEALLIPDELHKEAKEYLIMLLGKYRTRKRKEFDDL